MLEVCSKPKSCQKLLRKAKNCSRLLKLQKVAPNAKSFSKVAKQNQVKPNNATPLEDLLPASISQRFILSRQWRNARADALIVRAYACARAKNTLAHVQISFLLPRSNFYEYYYFPFFFLSFLGAPATQVEIYIMATSLDSDGDKEIDYREFKKMRRRIKASAPIEKAAELEEYEEPTAQLQSCPKCNVGLWEPVVEDVTG